MTAVEKRRQHLKAELLKCGVSVRTESLAELERLHIIAKCKIARGLK